IPADALRVVSEERLLRRVRAEAPHEIREEFVARLERALFGADGLMVAAGLPAPSDAQACALVILHVEVRADCVASLVHCRGVFLLLGFVPPPERGPGLVRDHRLGE